MSETANLGATTINTWEIVEKPERILQQNRPRSNLLFSQRIDPVPLLSMEVFKSSENTCGAPVL